MSTSKTAVIFIRTPKYIKDELQQRANEEGRTLSGQILYLLKHALATQKKVTK